MKILFIAAGFILMAPVFVMADGHIKNTVYGDFRYSLNYVDVETGGDSRDGEVGENNNSRLGFRGSVGGDGLKAIYHLQAGAENDPDDDDDVFTNRFYFAGVPE